MFGGLAALAVFALPLGAAQASRSRKHAPTHTAVHARIARAHTSGGGYEEPLCEGRASLCADPFDNRAGEYVGHDEPSVLFKSNIPGSGNDMTYTMTLPVNPTVPPNASGANSATWDFQLRPTFWFGLTLCDSQSAPEFTRSCKPDSDGNNLVGSDPRARDYIGKHPGQAFMELQFYGPGYVPQFEGFGCTATQYCAAMTIDSRTLNQNTGTFNSSACDNYILGGQEPVNWAYVTRSGQSQAPADPLFTGTFSNPNFSAVDPDPSKDLMMNPGDTIRVHIHDTSAGVRADLTDVTTGQSGSMTASVANGFAHILFTPRSKTCKSVSYAFHPEYSTANPRGNTWSAHTYNVAESDEVGHFENCLAIDSNFNCTSPGAQEGSGGIDADDQINACVPGTDSTVVMIDGCLGADNDYDGQTYQNDWPGAPGADPAMVPTPLMFTSPTTNGNQFSTVAFETDLPRIERSDSQANPPFCNQFTGVGCVNPPNGAQFYPFFSTTMHNGSCTWQEGGDQIPGTINDFGGSSNAEFGPLFPAVYPTAAGATTLIDNFNSGDQANPCFASSS
jgi:hypothetical protein